MVFVRTIFHYILTVYMMFLFGVSQASEDNEIIRIRINELSSRTQIVLDMKEVPDFNSFFLENPARLVVDVFAKLSQKGYSQALYQSKGVKKVRTGKRGSEQTRVVVDLRKQYEWKVYLMAPDNRKPNERIVIEIYDGGKKPKSEQLKEQKVGINLESVNNKNTLSKKKNKANLTAESKLKRLTAIKNQEKQLNIKPMLADEKSKIRVIDRLDKEFPTYSELNLESNNRKKIEQETKRLAEEKAKRLAEEKAKRLAEEKAKRLAEAKAKRLAEAKAKRLAEEKAKRLAEAKAKRLAEAKAKRLAEEKAKRLAEEYARKNMVTVVIDPGHGGYDVGALGKHKTLEKDIVLSISKKLKQKIDAIPSMRAKLTRSTDKHLKLRERLAIAHRFHGDIMISIHADAHEVTYAKGASVYILSNKGATSEIAKILEQTQNQDGDTEEIISIPLTEGIEDTLLEIQQDVTRESSHQLAKGILSELKKITRLHKSTVERGNFAVLKAADIPSVLVETAFLSNLEEEKKLKSKKYQEQLAVAIANAVKKYAKVNLPHKMKSKK